MNKKGYKIISKLPSLLFRGGIFLFICKFYGQIAMIKQIPLKINVENKNEIIWTYNEEDRKWIYINKNEIFKFNKIIIHFVDDNQINKSLKIKFPILKYMSNADDVLDIDYNEHSKSFAILLSKFLLIIDSNKFVRSISIQNFEYLYKFGKKSFVLIRQYNYHEDSEKNKFVIKKININDLSEMEKVFDIGHDIAYTMLINKFIDVFNDKIIYTLSSVPMCFLLDSNLNIIDTFKLEIHDFKILKRIENNNEYSFKLKIAKDVYFYLKKLDSLNSRIEKVYFNNDTLLVFTIKNPGISFDNRTILIYNLKTKSIIKRFNFLTPETYNFKTNFLDFTNSLKIIIKKNRIYHLNHTPKKKWEGYYMDDLYDKIDNYKRFKKYSFIIHGIQ